MTESPSLAIVATGIPASLEDYQVALNAAFVGGIAYGKAKASERMERIADDLQELCDKQAIRIGNLEMMAAATAGRDIKLAMAEANDKRLEALAQPEQEPDLGGVGVFYPTEQEPVAVIASLMPAERYALLEEGHSLHDALYTTPPQRKPLTDEQVEDCFPENAIFAETDGWLRVSAQTLHDLARNVEAAHGIKEQAC